MDFDAIASNTVMEDAKVEKMRMELTELRRKYRDALQTVSTLSDQISDITQLTSSAKKKGKVIKAPTKANLDGTAATAILCFSDFHVEERVRPEEVRGLNDYTLEEADRRIQRLTQSSIRMLKHEAQITNIDSVVVWLGGDVIGGHIHEELVESAQLSPLNACLWAGERINAMLDAVAKLGYPVEVVCNSGNHGRSTEKRRISGENDHSFEFYLYKTLEAACRRPKFLWHVAEGYHAVRQYGDFKVRFHHGHALRGGGGFGGLVPSANKAIAGWNQSQPVDYDIMGHFHSFTVSRKFTANGSLIGPSPFGDRLGFEAEPPTQAMVVVDLVNNRVNKSIPLFV